MSTKKNCQQDLQADWEFLDLLDQEFLQSNQQFSECQNSKSHSVGDGGSFKYIDFQYKNQSSKSFDKNQFFNKGFEDEDKKQFEQFLYGQLRGQTLQILQPINFNYNFNNSQKAPNKQKENISSKENKIQSRFSKIVKKVRYVQKNKSPKTVFNYHGTDIEVVYEHFNSAHADCLIMPYNELTLNQLRSLGFSKKLIHSIFRKLDCKKIQEMEDNQEIIAFNSKNDFFHGNYNWIYFFKKPSFKFIKEYSAKKLQICISAILEKVCRFPNNSEIVFPDFQWLGMLSAFRCEVFFSALLSSIYEQHRKRKVNLKKITVCCKSKQSFFQFTSKLRQLSDIFVRNGMIPLAKSSQEQIYR